MQSTTNQVKLYPVWSNFIYFIAALYAIALALKQIKWLDRILFFVFGVLILITGVFSIVYHLHTPSWTNNQNITETKRFKKWLSFDQSFAIVVGVYAILFLLYRILYTHWYIHSLRNFKTFPLWLNTNFYLSLLFILLSVIFYLMANAYNHDAVNCAKHNLNCFHNNLDAYDIFHSNWHIFTSILMIFWISLLKNTYKWK